MKVSSTQLKKLLKTRHRRDAFVEEIGTPRGGRIDALAVARSWTQACVYGYEIKTSRADFLRDDKWRSYLPFCNQFYFVCSSGTIDKLELSPEAGLITASKNGTRLYTVKKAPDRHADPSCLQEMFRAIIITRFQVTEAWDPNAKDSNYLFWRNWLMGKKDMASVGRKVARRLGELYRENVRRVDDENWHLKSEVDRLQKIKELLNDLGLENYGGVVEKMRHRLHGPDQQYLISALRSTYFRSRRTLLDIGEDIKEE